jgi:hypothetical protein
MSPETKKKLAYGAVIIIGGGIAIVLWKKHEANSPSNAQAQSDAEAQLQEQAQQQESQLAELSALGTSGPSLESPQLGETPVEDFGQELESVLQAAGLAPPTIPSSGSGATSSTPVATGTGSTGNTTATPTPIATPITPVPAPTPRLTMAPIITQDPIIEQRNVTL